MILGPPVSVLGDNYVWILGVHGSSRAAVVDPGDAGPVLQALRDRELELAAILLTHHHADHSGGVAELAARARVPVYGPARETISGVDHPVGEGDRIDAAGTPLEVLEVPGHTAGHVAYRGEGFVLSGDTLFAGGCGRLFEGTPEQMSRSLARLAALAPATSVHCAHEYTVANLRFALLVEPDNGHLHERLAAAELLRREGKPTVPSTIAIERLTNPFLRCSEPAVAAAAARFLGHEPRSEVEVFAAIRGWKDGWRG
jgi:hydroxyacylglutathione hydrolase